MDSLRVQIESVEVNGSQVTLSCSDGVQLEIEDCWLRDNCRCEKCYTLDTFQRAVHVLDIPEVTISSVSTAPAAHSATLCATSAVNSAATNPATSAVTSAATSAATPAATSAAPVHNRLQVVWSDGHQSIYDLDFIKQYNYDSWVVSCRREPKLWRGQDVDQLVAHVFVEDFLSLKDAAKAVFRSLLDYGVAFIEGVTPDSHSTELVCQALGGVQQTLFGGMWEFTNVAEHADTAYTTLPLAPHTDSTYFTESTGLQILHCIEHSNGTGGDTVLVDGFEGALDLKNSDPELFDLLTHQVFEAEYIEKNHHHRHAGPVLGLHPLTGDVQQVRFNVYDRSPGAFRSSAECRAYYKAMKTLAGIYGEQARQWWFKLRPGTVLVMDNWRVLHGRSAFSGKRVLCGSYVARSDWLDRARVLGLLH